MEPKIQETQKFAWEAPTFERTALKDAAFQQGQFIDGDGWDSNPIPGQ